MRINLPAEPDKRKRFLEALRAELESHEGSATLHPDGSFISQITARLESSSGQITTKWEITWKSEILDSVVVDLVGGSESGWEMSVNEVVNKALLATINPDASEIFWRQPFAYFGPLLDGEYFLPRFRIAPAPNQDKEAFFHERVILLDQKIKGIGKDVALEVAHFRAKRRSALLSLILDQGFYEIRPEHRWVLTSGDGGKTESVCLQLGYRDVGSGVKRMPEPGTACMPGYLVFVDRSVVSDGEHYVNRPLRCPYDIDLLIRTVDSLSEKEQESFYNAAALFQVAQVVKDSFPSVRSAYEVASVDALVPGVKSEKAFESFVKKFVPSIPAGLPVRLYGRFRSGHFHQGIFPGGEFKTGLEGMLWRGGSQLIDMNDRQKCHVFLRSVLIRWILSKVV